MRIAIVAPPWLPVPPTGYGGTESVLDGLARGLQAAGHDVLLFATGDSTCPVERAWRFPRALGTERVSPVAEVAHVAHAYERAVAWGAELVHDHTIVGPIHARAVDLPVVTTNHGPFDDVMTDCYRVIARTVPIVAISRHQAATAGAIPIEAVIPHGVDVDQFPIGDGSGGYALFLGRMSPDKGAHRAARVAQVAGVPLKIAAKMREPHEFEYFEREVAPLLGADVEFLGEVCGREKLELLAAATCLLNPIAWPEPFGLVMVEALACGTPVIAPPCGSVREIVDDGVTGFVRSDEEGMAAALLAVGSLNRERCRKVADERFATERMVADHVRLYRRVLARHRATTRAA